MWPARALAAILLLLALCLPGTNIAAAPHPTWPFGDRAVYFTSPGCRDCEDLLPLVERLSQEKGLELIVLDINRAENLRLMVSLIKARNLPPETAGTVPAFFTREAQMLGVFGAADLPTSPAPSPELGLAGVLAAGLADGLNPCTLNVLLVLLSMSLVVGRKNILKTGLLFILGVVGTYFLIGLGLGHVLSPLRGLPALRAGMYLFGGAGLLYLAFSPPSLLGRFKLVLARRINALRHPKMGYLAVFFLGVLSSGFEFVCTGQVYLPIVMYLAKAEPFVFAQNIFIYNLAFALPMLILVGAMHAGLDAVSIQRAMKVPLFSHASKVVAILLALYFVVQGIAGLLT
ncbi:MAG: hypothetical protein DDT35_00314 [Firmicutes bacterium]|nr:hypothetical protein [Bacillota bacterium]